MQRLGYLGDTYFHQDWDLEAPTPLGVVERFRDDETSDAVQELVAELDELIAASYSEPELEEIWLSKCNSMYNPRYEGMTSSTWFDAVRNIFQ